MPPLDLQRLCPVQAAFARACESHPLQRAWAVNESLPPNWAGWSLAARLAGFADSDRGAQLVQDAVRLSSLWQRVVVETSAEHSAHLQAQLLTDFQVFLDRLPAARQRALPLATVSNGPAMLPGHVQRQEAGGQPGRHVGAPRYTTRQPPTTSSPPQGPVKRHASAAAVAPLPQHTPDPGANPAAAAAQTAQQKQHQVLAALIPSNGAAQAASPAVNLGDLIPTSRSTPRPVASVPSSGHSPAANPLGPLRPVTQQMGGRFAPAHGTSAHSVPGAPTAAIAAASFAAAPQQPDASVPPLAVRADSGITFPGQQSRSVPSTCAMPSAAPVHCCRGSQSVFVSALHAIRDGLARATSLTVWMSLLKMPPIAVQGAPVAATGHAVQVPLHAAIGRGAGFADPMLALRSGSRSPAVDHGPGPSGGSFGVPGIPARVRDDCISSTNFLPADYAVGFVS